MKAVSELLKDISMRYATYDLILGDVDDKVHLVKVNPLDFVDFIDQNESRVAINLGGEIPEYFVEDNFCSGFYFRLIDITEDGDLTFTVASESDVEDISPAQMEELRWSIEYFKQEIKSGPRTRMGPMFINYRDVIIMDCRDLTEDEVTEQVVRFLFMTGASAFKVQGTGEFYKIHVGGVMPYVTFDAIDNIEGVRAVFREIIGGYVDVLNNIK